MYVILYSRNGNLWYSLSADMSWRVNNCHRANVLLKCSIKWRRTTVIVSDEAIKLTIDNTQRTQAAAAAAAADAE